MRLLSLKSISFESASNIFRRLCTDLILLLISKDKKLYIGGDYVRKKKKGEKEKSDGKEKGGGTETKTKSAKEKKDIEASSNTTTTSSPSTSKTGDPIVINVNTCDVIQREEN